LTPPSGSDGQNQSGASAPGVRQAVQQQSNDTGPPPVVQPCAVAKTWVEFRLVDMEGNPVSGQRYKVTLSDGSIQEGTLDKSGRVHFDGIVSGTCSISFLDLDKEAWERI
jgi:hypothetical protein